MSKYFFPRNTCNIVIIHNVSITDIKQAGLFVLKAFEEFKIHYG